MKKISNNYVREDGKESRNICEECDYWEGTTYRTIVYHKEGPKKGVLVSICWKCEDVKVIENEYIS